MKITEGLDLSYWPDSYLEFDDPVAAIVHDIKGEERRRLVRKSLESGSEVAERRLLPLLDRATLYELAATGPGALAGEYLPPDLPGETVIARIFFRTFTGHVVEIRARPRGARLDYRVVDELGTEYRLPEASLVRRSTPMRMAELIEIVTATTVPGRAGRGLVVPVLDQQFRDLPDGRAEQRAWIERVRAFVRASSEFYPGLDLFCERLVYAWVSRRGLSVEMPPRPARERYDLEGEDLPPDWALEAVVAMEGLVSRRWQAVIDAVVWKWRESQPRPILGMGHWALNLRAKALRAFLVDYVSELDTLPVGSREITSRDVPTVRVQVDFDELGGDGCLRDRILAEGVPLTELDSDFLRPLLDGIPVYSLDDDYYVLQLDEVEGPFHGESHLQDHYLEKLHEEGTVVAYQEWDSRAPGAGAGIVTAYRHRDRYFVHHEAGLGGPYPTPEPALREFDILRVSDATVEIWVEGRGIVYPRSRRGSAPANDSTTESGMAGDLERQRFHGRVADWNRRRQQKLRRSLLGRAWEYRTRRRR